MLTQLVVMLSIICMLLGASSFGQADSTGWKKTFDLNFNITQNSYSDNWTGGEAGNVTWISAANGVFEKQVSPKLNSKTTVKLAFGQTHTQEQETKKWAKPVKSTDNIDIESVQRLTMNWIVDPYFAGRFESQFMDASEPTFKRFINPMLLTFSGGIAKKLWYRPEKDELISRLGFAVREHISRDIDSLAIRTTKTNARTDGGLESVSDFNIIIDKDVAFTSKLSLFKALFNSKKDDLKGLPEADFWKAIDVNFENTVTASVSKYIQVQLYTQLLYDKEVDLGGRFKETLSLGLTYKLL
ncbi:MAG: DUF3078 domain-containing protein [Candidatus Zixiibacteriota bacterium]